MSSRSPRFRRSLLSSRLLLPALLTAVAAGLVGCSSRIDPASVTAQVAEADAAPPVARTVKPAVARDLVEKGVVVIDVRTPAEYDTGHVLGARNIDLQDVGFTDEVEDLDRSESYLVYCGRAACAAAAASQLLARGVTDVVDAGGFDGLEAVGVPVE